MTLKFYFDFDNDNSFSVVEDVSEWVMNAGWSIGMHAPYQEVGDETRLSLVLDNRDKRFSPEYVNGPYYGNFQPQRRVKVEAVYDGVTYPLYLGYIDAIKPAPMDGTTTEVSCSGAKQYMQKQLITLPLMENVRTDEVMQNILTGLHLPPTMTEAWILGLPGNSELGVTTYLADLSLAFEIDTGATTFAYVADNWDADFQGNQYTAGDWQTGFRGYDAIKDVVAAEQGRFFFNREGKAIFWNRARMQTNTTLSDILDGSDFLAKSLKYAYGERLYNDIHVMVYPRTIDAGDSILWELDEPVTVRPDKERKVSARYSERDSAETISAIDPYIFAFTTEDAVNIDRAVEWKATGATILLNSDNKKKKDVESIIIKGRRMVDYDKVEIILDDASSRALYGTREYRIDSKMMQNTGLAENIAEYALYRFKEPRGEILSGQFLVRDGVTWKRALQREIGDRVALSDEQTGHSAEYFIMGEGHQYNADTGYRVTWYFETADNNTYWLLGMSGYSELGISTRLGL